MLKAEEYRARQVENIVEFNVKILMHCWWCYGACMQCYAGFGAYEQGATRGSQPMRTLLYGWLANGMRVMRDYSRFRSVGWCAKKGVQRDGHQCSQLLNRIISCNSLIIPEYTPPSVSGLYWITTVKSHWLCIVRVCKRGERN